MEYNYLSLGKDCSPAKVLKALQLKTETMPFDWLESPPASILQCLKDNFRRFHQTVAINEQGNMICDEYGFRFPHDYPSQRTTSYTMINNCFARLYQVDPNFEPHVPHVTEKYQRRIERFRSMMADTNIPIIVLCRASINDVLYFNHYIRQIYGRALLYVVSSKETSTYPFIITVDTEQHEKWNDPLLWQEGIARAQQIYEYSRTVKVPVEKKRAKLDLIIGL